MYEYLMLPMYFEIALPIFLLFFFKILLEMQTILFQEDREGKFCSVYGFKQRFLRYICLFVKIVVPFLPKRSFLR